MLREEVLREWEKFRKKRKCLLSLRAWIADELFFYTKKSSQVSNEEIANAIRKLTGRNSGLEYLDPTSSEEEN
jgi:hypothetical protein